MIQRTFILDTNVYGEILIEPNREKLVQKIETTKTFFIYGVDIIEKELSETPSHVKYKGEITRDVLHTLFNSIVDKVITLSPIAKYLAEEYFREYEELSKKQSIAIKFNKENLKIDFQIIAIASLHSVDIVVSSDKRTMLSELSQKIYSLVNKVNSLRTPELLEYKEFKGVYLK